jgi:PLD-like domain
MRVSASTQEANNIGLRVQVFPGTRVVVMGFNTDDTSNLLGFAIERYNPATDEKKMMQGYKIFPSTGTGIQKGSPVDSDKHPFQSFQWSDYGAKPETTYQYTITAIGGKPKNLVVLDKVAVTATTLSEQVNENMNIRHTAVFNSGVAGSQAFTNKFPTVTSLKGTTDPAVWDWLSRGLRERLKNFIGEAKNNSYSLYGAFYEFHNEEILKEFKNAVDDRSVDVQLVVSWKNNPKKNSQTGEIEDPYPREINSGALSAIGVPDPENCDWIIKRTANPSYLQHNKFLILLKNGNPLKVWTGSTNISDSGIFGQSNVGHTVNDPAIAKLFFDYWEQLKEDPERTDLKGWVEENNPLPDPDNLANGTYYIMSPRQDEAAMDVYARLLEKTKDAAFVTQAFTIHKKFVEVLGRDLDQMRFVLLDKFDSRFTSDYEKVDEDYDVELAVGSYLPKGAYQRWVKEKANDLGQHVRFMHLKVILIDPVGNEPVLLTGSANFSKASTVNNDENTLIIKGDTDIADIYLGELSRLFNHHYFRHISNLLNDADPNTDNKIALLGETAADWVTKYDKPGTIKYKKRHYFCP